MKNLLLLLGCCLSALSVLHGDPVPLNQTVEKPPCQNVLKNPQSSASILQSLLDQGKLEEFYQKVKQLLQKNGRIEGEKNIEQLQNELWIFHNVAAAPLFQIDEDPDTFISWKSNRTLDYSVKTIAAQWIGSQNIPEISKTLSIPSDKLRALYALYVANILKTIRNSYDPELDIKQKRWEIEESDKIRKLFHEGKIDRDQGSLRFRIIDQKTNTRGMRNNTANMRTEILENTLLNLLVNYFPENTAKVKKYIKLAGYQDRDIPALIDRTVGRTPKTEFLYKGAGRKTGSRK